MLAVKHRLLGPEVLAYQGRGKEAQDQNPAEEWADEGFA